MEKTEPRRRDAAKTQRLLLDAARRRFADDGYAATTVRDIADDAGVNVALISRYFSSKEGLFEACLTSAVQDMRDIIGDVPIDRLAAVMARETAGFGAEHPPNQLALLLRSSGDVRADEIRLGVLRNSSERLAAAAGASPADETVLLRAQVVLAAAIGMTLLRTSSPLEPMASASEAELVAPMHALVTALLGPASAKD